MSGTTGNLTGNTNKSLIQEKQTKENNVMNLSPRNPDTASEIYRKLIVRLRKSIKDKERIVFDPVTGVQKCFLDGKLIWVKYVKGSGVMFGGHDE